MKVTAHFVLERETKGALRYNEVSQSTGRTLQPWNPEASVGTLYIRKQAFKGEMPLKITLTIETEE